MESVQCEKSYAPPPSNEGTRPVVLEVLYVAHSSRPQSDAGQQWYMTKNDEGVWENWVSEWLFPHLHSFLGNLVELRLIRLSYSVEAEQWMATTTTDGPLVHWSISILHQLKRQREQHAAQRASRRGSVASTGLATLAPRLISVLLCHGADAFLAKMLTFTANVQYRDFVKSLRGVVFYAAPHAAKCLAEFTEVVEAVLPLTREDAEGDTMHTVTASLATLTQVFDDLTKASAIQVLNFGTDLNYKDIISLRGARMISGSLQGEFYPCKADYNNLTKFEGKDNLAYVRTLGFVRRLCGAQQQETVEKRRASVADVGVAADHTIILRGYKTMYVAKGLYVELQDFANLTTRAGSDVLARIEYENLFCALVQALGKMLAARKLGIGDVWDAIKSDLRVNVVGNKRQVAVAKAFLLYFTCAKRDRVVAHALDVPCVYDMEYSLPHVAGVSRFLSQWNSYGTEDTKDPRADELQAVARQFKARALQLCFVGRTAGGQAEFVSSLLGRRVLPPHVSPPASVRFRSSEGDEESIELDYVTQEEASRRHWAILGSAKEAEQSIDACQQELAEYAPEEAGERADCEVRLEMWHGKLAATQVELKQWEAFLEHKGTPSLRIPLPAGGPSVADLLQEKFASEGAAITAVTVRLRHALLSNVELVATPYMGLPYAAAQSTCQLDSLAAAQGCDAWVYLQNISERLDVVEEDLRRLSDRSTMGLLCVTCIEQDSGLSTLEGIKSKGQSRLLSFLENTSAVCFCSCTFLHSLLGSTSVVDEAALSSQDLLDTLVGLHLQGSDRDIGNSVLKCSEELGLSAETLWRDFALEGSSLLSVLAVAFEMIETGIVVKEFSGILLDTTSYLSSRLSCVSDRIESVTRDIGSVQGDRSGQHVQDKKNQLMAKEHSLHSTGEEFASAWRRGMDTFKERFADQLEAVFDYVRQEVAAMIALHKKNQSRRVFKRMLKKKATEASVRVDLVGPVLENLAKQVEQQLRKVLSRDLDNLLLDKFPKEADLRQTVQSRISSGGALTSSSGPTKGGEVCKINLGALGSMESEHTLAVSKLDDVDACAKPFVDDAEHRMDQVLNLGIEVLRKVMELVSEQVQNKLKEYQERIKQLEEDRSTRQESGTRLPADLLHTRREQLIQQERQTLSLFAKVTQLAIPNALHSRKGVSCALVLSQDALTEPEQSTVAYLFWLLARGDVDSMPKHLQSRERALVLGPGIGKQVINEEVFACSGATLSCVTPEEWLENSRPVFVVEQTRCFALRSHTAEHWLLCDLLGVQKIISYGSACALLLHPAVRLLFVLNEE